MYQGNSTLRWRDSTRERETAPTGAPGFNELTELFDQKINQMILNKISPEIDRAIAIMKDLPSISNEDLFTAVILFEREYLLAVRVLHYVAGAGVNLTVFLNLLILAKKLAQERSEGEPVTTAFLLKAEHDAQSYQKTYSVGVGEPFGSDLFSLSGKELLEQAIKVNGEDRVFLVTSSNGATTTKWAIQTLKSASIVLSAESPQIDQRWALVAHNTQLSGCAFVVLGSPSARVKILIGGWQIAEYRQGSWCQANHKDIANGFLSLAQQTQVSESLLLNVLQKCLLASERRRGLSVIIQRKDQILPRCSPGYRDVETQPDAFGLKGRKMTDIADSEYIDSVAGDNAVIISSDGVTLAYQAALATSQATVVIPIPGTGSRHLSVQKMTKETDAIGIVVSADGPITVFLNGNAVQRYFL
jgi:hypothetical protein